MSKKNLVPLFLVFGTNVSNINNDNLVMSIDAPVGYSSNEERAINAVEKAQLDYDRQFESSRALRNLGTTLIAPLLGKLGDLSKGKQLLIDFLSKKKINVSPMTSLLLAGISSQLQTHLGKMNAEKIVDKLFGVDDERCNFSYIPFTGEVTTGTLYVVVSKKKNNGRESFEMVESHDSLAAAEARIAELNDEHETVKRFGTAVHTMLREMSCVIDVTDEKKVELMTLLGVTQHIDKILAYNPSAEKDNQCHLHGYLVKTVNPL